MLYIISYTAFTLELNIPNVDQIYVQERVSGFIDKYQKKFLKQLYGDVMGDLFIADLKTDPTEGRFYDLTQDEDLQNALASYVYYWYMRDNQTFSSGQGEKTTNAANSSNSEVRFKVSRGWKDMVDYCRSSVVDTEVFPEYVAYDWRKFSLPWFSSGYTYASEFVTKREIYFYLNPTF